MFECILMAPRRTALPADVIDMSDDEDEDLDDDPVLEEKSMAHSGGVNRVRVSACVWMCERKRVPPLQKSERYIRIYIFMHDPFDSFSV